MGKPGILQDFRARRIYFAYRQNFSLLTIFHSKIIILNKYKKGAFQRLFNNDK